MSLFVSDFLRAAALPALLVALLFFVTGRIKEPLRAKVQALLFAVAVCLSVYFSLGGLHLPPLNMADGAAWSALALALFVIIRPKPVGSRYALRAVFVVLLGALTLWTIRTSLFGPVNLRNLLAFFFLGLGVWSILERSSRLVQPPALIALPLISVVALTLLLMAKGSVALALITASVGALFGAVLVVALVAPEKVSDLALIPFLAAFVISLMAAAHFHLHINPWTLIYLCLPFFLLWIKAWIPFLPKTAAAEAIVLSAMCAIPLGYLLMNIYHVGLVHT